MVLQQSTEVTDRVLALENQMQHMDGALVAIGQKMEEMCEDIKNMAFARKSGQKSGGELEQTETSEVCSGGKDRSRRGFFDEIMIPKVQLEKFDPSIPIRLFTWITMMEMFFKAHDRMSDEEKIRIAGLHLVGTAIQWFAWWETNNTTYLSRTWIRFKESLIKTYSDIGRQDPFTELTRLTQKGQVQQFNEEFRSLSTLVTGVDNARLIQVYITGLKSEIQARLRTTRINDDLDDVMLQARSIEAEFRALRGYSNNSASGNQGRSWPRKTEGADQLGQGKGEAEKKPEGNTKSLTRSQVEEHMRKGTCFKCGAKWNPTHKCAIGTIHIIECDEDTTMEEEPSQEESNLEEEEREELDTILDEGVTISLQAITGIQTPKTIRLEAQIKGVRMIILVDGGSTHNFINRDAAKAAGLIRSPINTFQVAVAGRQRINCGEWCRKVPIKTGDYEFSANMFCMPVAGVDIVLGVQWLMTLGNVMFNYQKLFLYFKKKTEKGEKKYLLRGLTDPVVHEVSSHRMEKILRRDPQGLAVSCHCIQATETPDEIQKVVDEFQTIFEEIPPGLPPSRGKEHAIEMLPNVHPINVRPYRHPYHHKKEIETIVRNLLAKGHITPSCSPYAAPVILHRKKDGTYRMCVDYRALNKVTVKNKYPIPHIDDLFDELGGARYFTKIDLTSGYHQIRVRQEDTAKTAFRTHEGLYEFKVMPFGLTNAPATFQATMNDLLRPYLRHGALVFFDDILVYSSTLGEHVKLLRAIFQILLDQKLFANKKKCSFGQQELIYLGHVITAEGIKPDPGKIRAILEWPTPSNATKVREFLGAAAYNKRYIKGYGIIAAPLHSLTGHDPFVWDSKAEHAFEELKQALANPPVLAYPDFHKPFLLECDACDTGVGAVLKQEDRPIAYESRKLNMKERAKPIYEKEMLAILHAIKKWRPYLIGTKFIVKTDHDSLKYFLNQEGLSEEQQKWVARLQGYDFEIQYKKGKDNVVADALSRQHEISIHALITLQPKWISQLTEEYEPTLIREVQEGSRVDHTYKDGIIYKKGRILIPTGSKFKQVILNEHHDSPTAGHGGQEKTYRRIKERFIWKGLRNDVFRHVAECPKCQTAKSGNDKLPGLLQPLPIPEQKWESISMDFITGLPMSERKDCIFVVVDRLTKYAHFMPISSTDRAPQIAHTFLKEIHRLHGFPKVIISDRDPKFNSHMWQEMFRLVGTQLNMSTSYHPQTDGQTEVVNKSLETYLRIFCSDKQGSWSRWLPLAEWWYNTSYHLSIKMTPFEALYGYPPPSLVSLSEPTKSPMAEAQVKDIKDTLRLLKDNLTTAQNRMKQQADRKRVERIFDVGDWVYLRLQPYKQSTLKQKGKDKLQPKFYGPYQIIQKIGEVAYRLDLPTKKIHNTFHVSCLKRVLGKREQPGVELPILDEEGRLILEPEYIIEIRTRQLRSRTVQEYLVKWKGLPPEDASWENQEWRNQNQHIEVL